MMNQRVLYALSLVIFLLLLGTIFYSSHENWSSIDSFYFSTMTLTTIGYGDLVPSTTASKLFTSFYAIIGVGVMLYVLGTIISSYLIQKETLFGNFILKLNDLRRNKKGKILKQSKKTSKK